MTGPTVKTLPELTARLREAKGQETILVEGRFGAAELAGVHVRNRVTIAAASPGAAHFERLSIRDCRGLHFAGLTFWPEGPVERSRAKLYLFTADPLSSDIEVSSSVFRGRADSDGHTRWSKAEWDAAKIGAVFLRGPRGVIRNNAAIGVNFGYNVTGESSEIFGNTVFGFSGDGLRVAADNCVVIGNRVMDAVQIDANHPDGFQAFKQKGQTLNGLVVKDNVILEWTVRPNNPLRARLQGLSLHDGPYTNVVIRDNSVACSSPNGIRVNRTRDLELTGNRVRHADGKRGNDPKIRLSNCSGRIVVEGNQAEKFVVPTGLGRNNREPDYSVAF